MTVSVCVSVNVRAGGIDKKSELTSIRLLLTDSMTMTTQTKADGNRKMAAQVIGLLQIVVKLILNYPPNCRPIETSNVNDFGPFR